MMWLKWNLFWECTYPTRYHAPNMDAMYAIVDVIQSTTPSITIRPNKADIVIV